MATENTTSESVLNIQDVSRRIGAFLSPNDILNFSATSTTILSNLLAERKALLNPKRFSENISNNQNLIKEMSDYLGLIKQHLPDNDFKKISQLAIFKDYNALEALYKKINEVSNDNKATLKSDLFHIKNQFTGKVLIEGLLITLLTIPPISLFTLVWAMLSSGGSAFSNRDGKYCLALILFPPLLLYHIGWTIYTAIKLTVEYVRTKDSLVKQEKSQLLAEQVTDFLGRVIAHHADAPTQDNSSDVNLNPQAIAQRDELINLFLGQKFAGTNSTGILNIQAEMKKHPDMSCEKCFALIENEISHRYAPRNSTTAFFRNINRHDKVNELYKKLYDGHYQTNTTLKIQTSQQDRQQFIDFINATPSFVTPTEEKATQKLTLPRVYL